MLDSTQARSERAITVPFHGADLYVVEHNGQPYTPMKPIVEGVGVSWQGQHEKLSANGARWGIKEILIPSKGGLQAMLSLPLRKLAGWLMTLSPNKIKNTEVRAKVIQYQNECDDVLWQYWTDGIAINPRAAYAVNPGDLLTKDEAETLRLMLKSAADRLPKDRQAAAMIQGWSKLKSHFGVPYREIPRHEFSEAVSIIARHTTEWELVAEKLPNAIVSLPTLRNRRWLLATDFEGREVVIPVPDDASMISFTKDSYYGIVERIPMERIPDMLAELQKRVASHIGAFSAHLQRGSAQRGAQCS